MSFEENYDFVVIGGGSSGCIVASGLAKLGIGKVLLLESGDWAERYPESLSADGFVHAFANDNLMWDRLSTPQEYCSNRSLYLGSGTGMGGSGSVNGMVYTRGDKKDYEQWPEGWRWDQLSPFFEKLEETLKVKPRQATNYTETCINAAQDAGFQQKDWLTDGDLCGYLGYQTMNYDGDLRRSSYVSFVKDQFIENLTIVVKAHVSQLTFNKNKKITSVIYSESGKQKVVKVSKEVILCAGALETPKLLMLSGVGPFDQLSKYAIPQVELSENIGRNLQDHPNVCVFYKGKQTPDSRYPQLYGFNRANPSTDLENGQADTCYVFYSAPASLKQSMKRMLPAVLLPAALFKNPLLRRFLRSCVDLAYSLPVVNRFLSQLYGIVVILGKPESRGRVMLRSADSGDDALVSPNYYEKQNDIDTMVKGVELANEISKQSALKQWGNTPLVAGARTSNKSKIEKWIKNTTMTTFHYCGTCKMGSNSSDPITLDLKLRGVKGVRVADASIMPVIPVSALNAPSMMIGMRAVEFIAETYTEKSQPKSIQKIANKVAAPTV